MSTECKLNIFLPEMGDKVASESPAKLTFYLTVSQPRFVIECKILRKHLHPACFRNFSTRSQCAINSVDSRNTRPLLFYVMRYDNGA